MATSYMRSSTEIVAYTVNASMLCVDHTPIEYRKPGATTDMGDPVHPVFAHELDAENDTCDSCLQRIEDTL